MNRITDIISVSIHEDKIEVICLVDKGDIHPDKTTIIFIGSAMSVFNCYWQYYSTSITDLQPTNKMVLEYLPTPGNPSGKYYINIATCSNIDN
ncbi:hypothetical protein M5U04_20730 [Xenorhabdus sp. XENO-1]|uniref:hypothetical protein n=1 Tax=Xenorhabdus bovienii TaxID=40576 RepID=UPI0020CA53FB|nr:hypothetical protein [Xenorhabdus bovienii]MCP9270426.1 hypothetical protein [Xenorhabdus bovienii subsp. africana]